MASCKKTRRYFCANISPPSHGVKLRGNSPVVLGR
nr:MAG TPA: hypothetical protein [Caudoviricetes sp.]